MKQLQNRDKSLRLFLIGNSFSQDATRYLPQLANEIGCEISFGRAETGGCSLQRHWEAFQNNAAIYNGEKSLRQLIGNGEWDVVTMQQASMSSPDLSSYQPYTGALCDAVRELCPDAEILLHQTWPYRCDAPQFGATGDGQYAQSSREMWQHSRAAYHQMAAHLDVRLIPVGDAFREAGTDAQWRYEPDLDYDFDQPRFPFLPWQNHSLHVGYYWDETRQLKLDPSHASAAGSYLGSLVWCGFLFDQSLQDLTFAPSEIAPPFAAHLRAVAAHTLSAMPVLSAT